MLKKALLLFSCLFGCILADQSEVKSWMLQELDTVHGLMHLNYAPAEWKAKHLGWNLQAEIDKAKQRIEQSEQISVKQFQRTLRDFANSTIDYHVGVKFYATEAAILPFEVKKIGERYIITYVDRSKLPLIHYPINVGDELLTFDGQPIDAVVQKLKQEELGSSDTATHQSLAELTLTTRSAASGQTVPRGPVTIETRSGWSGYESSMQLVWQYMEEEVPQRPIKKDLRLCGLVDHPSAKKLFGGRRSLPHLDHLKKRSTPHTIGGRESFLPRLGKVIWESDEDNPFDAYIFQTPERKLIGCLRIPHHLFTEEDFLLYQDILYRFEELTDGLIIDQLNNPGGDIGFTYALASTLTYKPLIPPKERWRLTYEDIHFLNTTLKPILDSDPALAEAFVSYFLAPVPISPQHVEGLRHFIAFMNEEWMAGKSFTDPTQFLGIEEVLPNPYVRYTKPFLMLINELDFSCGDFFPAIVQDNQIGLLAGTKTAGAGGGVISSPLNSQFGVAQISYTITIAERPNGDPIENLGVTPDIPLEISEDDPVTGYAIYASQVLAIMDAIVD